MRRGSAARVLKLMLLAQLEEFCHLLEALFAGHGGKGVVDTCLQIELAVFLLQSFGDEDDVDTGEALVQESDVLAVLLRGAFFVKNGCVVPFADTVDDFRRFVAG